MRICVYGAASNNVNEIYIAKTEELGREMAKRGHSLIYGGGSTGMMGAVARGVHQEGGEIISVVPTFMETFEPLFEDYTEMIKTDSMAERKVVMEKNADVFIITPGGIGTYDEFYQILTLSHLNRNDAPIVIYNLNGYYDETVAVIDKGVKEGFISKDVYDNFTVETELDKLFEYIEK